MSRLARSITIGGKQIDVPVTVADQVINWWDPVRGSQRYQARLRMALTGGYTGADRTRRANQLGGRRELSADAAILPDLTTLRSESQHLARNNPIACGAIGVNVTKVVGCGLKAKAQIDRDVLGLSDEQADKWERAAEREYKLATETREIDAERQLPFSLMQGLAILRTLEDGDILVNMPRFARPGSPYRLKLQLIEAARVCNRNFTADTVELAAGVKIDARTGETVGYQVLNRHPSQRLTSRTDLSWTDLNAFDRSGRPLVLHLLDKRRPGQRRGVPYLAPVIELIKQLGRYTDAEVMAAVVTGMLTVFVTNETGNPRFGPAPTATNPDGTSTDQIDATGLELGYGSVVGLNYGDKIETVNPMRPNTAFDPFFIAIMRQVGMALEIPFEVLVKHFTSSYSAAKAAIEEAWSYFLRRRHWLVTMLCQPVYEAVISEAVASGRLAAPGFFADPLVRAAWLGTTWIGGPKNSLDELKEINAAARRIELTISTLDEESRKLTGTPWEDKLPQVLRERAILRAAGISITAMEAAAIEPDPDDQGNTDEPEETGEGREPTGQDDLETTDRIERTKRTIEAYGVGVRAGGFTPQQDDELHFRTLLRIPAATPPVSAAWKEEGGTRRPITLAHGKESAADPLKAEDQDDNQDNGESDAAD